MRDPLGVRCSDPYESGCRQPAVVFVRGWRFADFWGWQIEAVEIRLCRECMYWDCDHDWEGHPDGPGAPESCYPEREQVRA